MDMLRLNKTADFLKTELYKLADYKDSIMRMAEYRIEHSYRVASIGAKIALAEGFDVEKTYIACLLHDIGYVIDYDTKEDYRNHGRYGARIARPFLLSLGYSEADVNEMCYGIAIHVDDRADFEGERTPMALTVGDADNIDRFDAYRLYEGLHFRDYMNLPLEKQREHVQNTLARLPKLRALPCGTKTGETLWKEKIDYQIGFYRRLLHQIETSHGFDALTGSLSD